MAQSIVKRGSVVLIRYPFTDLTGAKVRPALVVTPDHLLPRLEDVLCLFISSAMPDDILPTDFVLELGHPSFLTTGLKRRSVLRMHKLALLHKVLVLRVLGEGDPSLMYEVDQRLRLALHSSLAVPILAPFLRATQAAAQALGVELQVLEVRTPNEFDGAFAAATSGRAEALIVMGDAFLADHRTRVVDFAQRNRLPGMYPRRSYVDVGGLMTYSANIPNQQRRAATYVDKILKGAKPADLPVEQTMKFELVINLKAAKALGITIPPSVFFQADEVIQ